MAAPDPLVGTTLGKFTIEKKLGQGGMGAVYKARDNLGRTVALKLLPAHFAAQPEWLERFRREASRAALLDHPNIVQVFEQDQAGGNHYISMQFMEGGSLEGLLRERGALPPREAARLVRDAAKGLARAHLQGVIHRDIKPANILLGDDGEVRLGDFGLVKSVEGDDQPLTQTGMVLGTPHYMAPEQCEGLPDVDGRADLYALGLVLYQALSNVLPVKGTTPLQIIRHRLEEDPPSLASVAPSVPAELVAIVDALLVRDRDRRLAKASDLVARLDAFLDPAAAAPSSGAALTTAAAATPLPPIDLPARTVPTAKLVRYDRPGQADADVLPDLGDTRPPRRPPGAADPGSKARRPAPPKRSSWACWFLGCGLLGVVGACIIGAGLAQYAEEQEQLRRQQELEAYQRQQQLEEERAAEEARRLEEQRLLEEQRQLEQELRELQDDDPPPGKRGKGKPW